MCRTSTNEGTRYDSTYSAGQRTSAHGTAAPAGSPQPKDAPDLTEDTALAITYLLDVLG